MPKFILFSCVNFIVWDFCYLLSILSIVISIKTRKSFSQNSCIIIMWKNYELFWHISVTHWDQWLGKRLLRSVSSIYVWSKNFSHSAYVKFVEKPLAPRLMWNVKQGWLPMGSEGRKQLLDHFPQLNLVFSNRPYCYPSYQFIKPQC
jgi:hypothetical protein